MPTAAADISVAAAQSVALYKGLIMLAETVAWTDARDYYI